MVRLSVGCGVLVLALSACWAAAQAGAPAASPAYVAPSNAVIWQEQLKLGTFLITS